MGDSDWNVVNRRNRRLVFERLNPSQTHKLNADELAKLSLSIYVANFPSHLTVRELWNICGKVVNSKTLIDSLSNVWIGKLCLHANVAKFDQNVFTVPPHVGEKVGKDSQPNKTYTNGVKNMDAAKSSFASVLNVGRNPKSVMDPSQPIVLDDDCILERDLSCTLMGKINGINALSNLYVILANEGFDNVNLTYLGGFWVLIDVGSSSSKEKLLKHVGVASWFTELLPANNSFVSDERLVWISVEGLPIKTWTNNTFAKIVSPWGVMADVDVAADSTLPFKKYVYWLRVKELDAWTPDFSNDFGDNSSSDEEFVDEDVEHVSDTCDFEKEKEVDHVSETSSKQDSKGDDPTFPLGFTPNVIEDTEVENIADSINQANGNSFSNKDGSSSAKGLGQSAKKNWIRELNAKYKVSFVAIQETKVEKIDLFSLRNLWDNFLYDFAFSPSVRYSGGLLCVWDSNLFSKDSVTISDSFVAILEKPFGSILVTFVDQWDGESVILGDFNDVKSEQERFGTNFNASSANAFNQFISTAGLVDLPLEGYSFTWAHKLASKMSKLDRFLVTEGLLSVFPSLSAICLDRHLSNHMPILVRDLVVDYGPTPFRVFHSWTSLIKDLQDIKARHALDMAQKAKIRWAIEGDENSTYFHGIINKKRSQLVIRGVLVDGDWIKEPSKVKNEFLTYFSNLLSKPTGPSINLDPQMFRRLSTEQNVDLESNVTYEEIRKVIIDQDVVNAVQEFFVSSKFPPRWNSSFITLIPKKQDVKIVKDFCPISLIVNGSPTSEFKFHKGLKQGDPLSPFLFILVMESLHLSFNNILSAGLFKGIRINGFLTLSHMFYADDAVFIGKWDKANFITIVHVFKCFFLASGLKINIHKSKLMGIGISHEEVNMNANLIGCTTFTTPFNCLGVKVGAPSSKNCSCDEVLAKISTRLSKWKIKTLSIGGCLTLIKSFLTSLPLYHMSIYKVPIGVLNRMESIRRRFFNGADNNERKISMIGWQKVLASKKKGGLRISSLFALNRALLFKWIWRFISHGTSLWFRFIKAMYGDRGALDNPCVVSRSSLWYNIIRELVICPLKLYDISLMHAFLRLYTLESNKQVTVAAKLSEGYLTDSFRRAPRGGIEEEQLLLLVNKLESVILANLNDRWIWSLESLGEFSVKSARSYIDDTLLPIVGSPTRWVKVVLIKINIFAWKVCLDKLPTTLNLYLCGIDIPSIICPICSSARESGSHLLFGCNMARLLMQK
ncbi:RNA-directed DNA polymerase, eukaryota [Tanacetum coccineum]